VLGFVCLAAAVRFGWTDDLDHWIRAVVGPWRGWRLRRPAYGFVDTFGPGTSLPVLVLATIMVGVARRSMRPLILTAAVAVPSSIVVLAFKILMARPDPKGLVMSGGSFPSGHTFSLLLASGLIVVLLNGRRWAWTVPVALGVVMGCSLIVIRAHWLTDVLGGALLATAAVAAGIATGLQRWALGHRSPTGPGDARSMPGRC
jgi:undecaprenyl-diphosphatase